MKQNLLEVERIKLLMIYDLSKTLNENLIISEENISQKANIELVTPEKNVKLISGRTYKWTIINREKNQNLKIQKVEINPPGQNYSAKWNCADTYCKMKNIYVSSFSKDNIKPNWQGYVNLTIGWGYDSYYERDLYGQKGFNFQLLITTNLGQITTTLRSGGYDVESKQMAQVRTLQDKFIERKSEKGYKVPDYFSPTVYDEFISQVEKVCGLSSLCIPLINKMKNGVDVTPDEMKSQGIREDIVNQYTKLYNKYRDEKFPTGINPEYKELFYNQFNSLKKEIDKFEKSHMVTRRREPYDQYFDERSLTPKQLEEYRKLTSQLRGIKTQYGFDDRNLFDKFWEEYGLYIQLGLAAITVIASFGASSVFAGVLSAGAIKAMNAVKMASTAADFIMNAAVGTYQFNKGDDKEALMSFFFAVLPQVHKIYPKIAKVFGAVDTAVAKSLAEKFGSLGIKSLQDLEAALKVLPKEEAIILRKTFFELQPKEVSYAIKLLEKKENLLKLTKVGKAGEVGKSFVKGAGKLATIGTIDFAIIKSVQEFHSKVVELVDEYCDCVTTPKEREEMKTYLQKLSPQQMSDIGKLVDKIQIDEAITDKDKSVLIVKVCSGGLEREAASGINEKGLEELKKKHLNRK